MKHVIVPDWPAPAHVKAYTTLRTGGTSQAPYETFNLAKGVGDDEHAVKANRAILNDVLSLPNEPVWISQTHSTIVLPARPETKGKEADATFANQPEQVCAVMTADCLPIFLCDRSGTHVAAIHAGWRGLAHGIIENTLQTLNLSPENILIWLGPAIGPKVYELGEEVRDIFVCDDPQAEKAFVPSQNEGRWLGDLYALARLRLRRYGVSAIYGGEYCTYSDAARFFSYRRDGGKTGRMASLIWIT